METGVMLDAVLGILMLGIGMMMRRFWQLVDNLRESDMTLHNRITKFVPW